MSTEGSGGGPDPFAHDDAAYVLGALDPHERTRFEAHLAGCAECSARVRELAGVPALLAAVPLEDLLGAPEQPPETLWPGLARRARAERRRRNWLTGGLGGLAAAAIAALLVAVWPSSSPAPTAGRPQAMTSLVSAPLQATAALTQKGWGTEIDLVCSYDAGAPPGYAYGLRVVDTSGHAQDLGTWTLAGSRTTFSSGTSLRRDQIANVQITVADQPILQLVLHR
jgi:hypothetical protein